MLKPDSSNGQKVEKAAGNRKEGTFMKESVHAAVTWVSDCIV